MTSTTNEVVYINYSTTAKFNILTALIECLTILLEYIDILIIMQCIAHTWEDLVLITPLYDYDSYIDCTRCLFY